MSNSSRHLQERDCRGGKRPKMVLHGFTSDLPSKSLFPKRARRNSHRLRLKRWQRESQSRLVPSAKPPHAVAQHEKYLGLDSDRVSASIPFSFSLSEWTQMWQDLHQQWKLKNSQSPTMSRRNSTAGEDSEELLSIMKKLSFSEDFTVSATSSHFNGTLDMKPISQEPFHILRLPREIRDLIYSIALLNTMVDDTRTRIVPIHIFHDRTNRMLLSRVSTSVSALLSTSHQILGEALPIFYRINRFYLRGIKTTSRLSLLGPVAFRNIQSLDLFLGKSTPVQAGLFSILQKVSELPRLKQLEVRVLPEFDVRETFQQGYTSNCKKCEPSSCAIDLRKKLVACSGGVGLRLKIAYCSIKEKSTCNPVAPSCSVCAVMSMANKCFSKVKAATSRVTAKTINVHVCRIASPRSTTNYNDPLNSTVAYSFHRPVLLPGLKDDHHIRRPTKAT